MTELRVGVLNNLRSGRSSTRVSEALALLASRPEIVHVETRDGSHVPEALAHFEREGVGLLVVNGGDGTVQRVLTELLGARRTGPWLPRIAPIRGGRTNMTASDLGARRNPIRGLAEVLDAARAGLLDQRAVERPVLRVELGPDGGVHYGTFCGIGMLYQAVQLPTQYLPRNRAQGLFGAGAVLATLVARAAAGRLGGVLTAEKIQLAMDGEPPEHRELRLVMATTAERLFLGIRPFWGRESGSVRLTTIAADAKGLARAAVGILRGRPPVWVSPEFGYLSRNCDEVIFRVDCGVTIDGELFHPAPGRIVRLTADHRVRFVRA